MVYWRTYRNDFSSLVVFTALSSILDLCRISAMPFLEYQLGSVLQEAIEFHMAWIFDTVTYHSIHCATRLVFGYHHDSAQKMLQTSFVFRMVPDQTMNFA